MKTAREWFKMLPPDIEKMAVENAWNYNSSPINKYESLSECIEDCFLWSDTPQKHNFWRNIHEAAERGEYDEQSR